MAFAPYYSAFKGRWYSYGIDFGTFIFSTDGFNIVRILQCKIMKIGMMKTIWREYIR